nr:MAG TPA: ParB protein [Caudoviricetes sp.]
MDVVEKPINDIIPYEKNPRHNDEAVKYVANSIRQFGFKVPLVIDKDNVVTCGHTRLKVAKLLGLTTVPCVIADDLTPEQIQAFRLADNKVSEKATWDDDLLGEELRQLDGLDFSMENFGFDLDGLDPLGNDDEEQPEKGNERQRTMDAYNLDDYDPGRTAGFYQMPLLRKCTEVPAELIGFNYMLTTDPRPGLGIHFYVDDYQFERVWNDPGTYCEKLAAFDFVLTPDFSLYLDMPMAMKVWNVYRSRLIGQILQDMGVNVIPTLSWAEDATFQFCFDGIEPGGTVSVSTIGVKRDEAAAEIWEVGMDEAMKRLTPSTVLVYGGDIGYPFPCQAIYFDNAVTENMKRGGQNGRQHV